MFFTFSSWFEGDLGSVEAAEILQGQKPATFLVRFSKQVGAYAVSFVGPDGAINHSLIEHEGVPGNGYRIQNTELVFPSLKEVVNYYGDALKYPLKATSNELHGEALKYILQWKKERAKQMEAVEKIVDQLFDISKEVPIVKTTEKDPRVEDIVSRLFDTM